MQARVGRIRRGGVRGGVPVGESRGLEAALIRGGHRESPGRRGVVLSIAETCLD